MPFLAFGQEQILPQWEELQAPAPVDEWMDEAVKIWHPQGYIQAQELRSYTDRRGWMHRVNGYRVRNLHVDTRPTSTAEMAKRAAQAYYAFKYQVRAEEFEVPSVKVTTPRLVILQEGYPAREGRWLLAWEVSIVDALHPDRSEILYIDAIKGDHHRGHRRFLVRGLHQCGQARLGEVRRAQYADRCDVWHASPA